MKKVSAVAILLLLIYACSPKVGIGAMRPDPVQVPPRIASASEEVNPLPVELEEGKSMYENRCSKCHDLYKPTDFTKEQWVPIMKKMQIKAKIDNAQRIKIYNYIVSGLQ